MQQFRLIPPQPYPCKQAPRWATFCCTKCRMTCDSKYLKFRTKSESICSRCGQEYIPAEIKEALSK